MSNSKDTASQISDLHGGDSIVSESVLFSSHWKEGELSSDMMLLKDIAGKIWTVYLPAEFARRFAQKTENFLENSPKTEHDFEQLSNDVRSFISPDFDVEAVREDFNDPDAMYFVVSNLWVADKIADFELSAEIIDNISEAE